MVKKLFYFTALLSMFTLVGCGNNTKNASNNQKEVQEEKQEQTIDEEANKRELDSILTDLTEMESSAELIGQNVIKYWDTNGVSYQFAGLFTKGANDGRSQDIIDNHWDCISKCEGYETTVKTKLQNIKTEEYKDYATALQELYTSNVTLYKYGAKFPEGESQITYTNNYNDYKTKCSEKLSAAQFYK